MGVGKSADFMYFTEVFNEFASCPPGTLQMSTLQYTHQRRAEMKGFLQRELRFLIA
jgi:hypothetical protein